MLIINPKDNNPYKTKAVEPPVWCALLAKEGDRICDNNVEDLPLFTRDDVLIVAMGSNPSASSTPKMMEVNRLKKECPDAKITGLHPMALGQADVNIPRPEELVKIKRAMWELLPMDKYIAHNWHCLQDIDNRGNYAALYTSYGCPYNCDFCNIHTIYKTNKVYFRDPEDVVSETDYLVRNYNIHNLKFCDELFTLNNEHVSQIMNGIKDYHLNIWAYAKVGTVNPRMLKSLKQGGVNWLAYGFESSNDKVLSGVSKKRGDAFRDAQMTREAGINIMGNFIFGLPDDTLDTMNETLDMAQKLECEYVNFYTVRNYPGSKLYDGKDKDWSHYDQYTGQPPNSKYLSAKDIHNFRQYAFHKYFTDKNYLEMVERKFGSKAKAHIMSMVKLK